MRLCIYCAGGIGREAYDIAITANAGNSIWKDILFIDDKIATGEFYGTRQLAYGQFKRSCPPSECRVVIANGEPSTRKMLADKVRGDGYVLESLIDPTARISPSARLGEGVIIYPNTYISSCADIGDNVLIGIGSGIGHDSIIGHSTVVSTLVSISGNCVIGSGCYIGTESCIKEDTHIGANTIIGMGSCVSRDVGPGMIALGNPAREVRANIDQKVFHSSRK
jgi:sugar O-acyltransferase (sialic acid O-acetyltransferase NeuD family)